MNARQQAELQRRWALVQRSGQLRERLAQHTEALAPAFVVVDRTRRGARWLREHPVVPLVAGLLLLWRRPRAVLRWGGRAWAAWGTIKRVRTAWRDWRGVLAQR